MCQGIETGHTYRHYCENGAQLEGGSLIATEDVENQYDQAIEEGPIRSIIMDGGGNDLLLGGESEYNEAVDQELKAAWIRILDKAQSDGVQNMVVQGYYMTDNTTLDVADLIQMGQFLETKGAQRGITLVYVNPATDPWFANKNPSEYTRFDGIHPTEEASEQLANMVWDAMEAHNIEQGAGCEAFTP